MILLLDPVFLKGLFILTARAHSLEVGAVGQPPPRDRRRRPTRADRDAGICHFPPGFSSASAFLP